jgi:hypothetical protein
MGRIHFFVPDVRQPCGNLYQYRTVLVTFITMALRLAPFRSIPALSRISAVSRLTGPTMRLTKSRWVHFNSDLQHGPRPILCGHDCSPNAQQLQCAFFSTEASASSSSSFSPIDWWRKRQETQEAEKYKSRIVAMAEKEALTIGDMIAELDEVVNSWRAKMPGVSSLKETQMAKQMHKTLSGIIKVMGKDATNEMLNKMARKEKLKAALEGGTTVEEINTVIDQFRTMALMQQVIRKRRLEGKTIPTTAEGIQAIVQAEGSKMLSKAQKSKMGKEQARKILRRRR